MQQWVEDNRTLIIVTTMIIFAIIALGMIYVGFRDWRSARHAPADVARIRGGYTTEQPALTDEMLAGLDETMNLSAWERFKKATEPRYADIPTTTMATVAGVRHGDPSEDWTVTDEQVTVEEDAKAYVGKHRLPEVVTAEYLKGVFTQTMEVPRVRTLRSDWRGAVA